VPLRLDLLGGSVGEASPLENRDSGSTKVDLTNNFAISSELKVADLASAVAELNTSIGSFAT
jgi:hypothetical protein